MVDVSRVVLAVDSRQVKTASRDLDGLDRVGRQTTNTTQMLGRAFMGLAASVGGIYAVRRAFDSVIAATREQDAAIAQLRQGLISTGGEVGRSLDELTQKAAQLQLQSTFGDESIISAMSQLITFTSITGDQFDRTTQAVLDLSTRMGTDLTSSVIQVGKALNDPVANLGALGRAGIQFSDAQTELIKELAETNRLAEAQDVILAELETQFGGSARAARHTLGGAIQSLGNAFGDLLEADTSGAAVGRLTGAINNLNREITDPSLKEGMGGFTEWLINTSATGVEVAGMLVHASQVFSQIADDMNASKLIPTTSAAGDLLGVLQGFFSGGVEAARGAGLFREAIDDLADEMVATVEIGKDLVEVTSDLESEWQTALPVAADLTETYQEMDRQMDDLVDNHEKLARQAQRVTDKLNPNEAAVRKLKDEYDLLEWAVRNNLAAHEDLEEWVNRNVLQEVEVGAKRATAEVVAMADEAEPLAAAYERGLERMDDGFADFFKTILRDGKVTFDNLKNIFLDTLGEMIYAAARNRILIGVTAAGGSSAASASGGGAGGLLSSLGGALSGGITGITQGIGTGLSNLGLTGAGDAFYNLGLRYGGGSTLSNLGNMGMDLGAGLLGSFAGNAVFGDSKYGGALSGIGGLAGAAFGGPIGAALGSFLGSGLGSLFGGDSKPSNRRAVGQLNLSNMERGSAGSSSRALDENVQAVDQIMARVIAMTQAIGGSSGLIEVAAGRTSGLGLAEEPGSNRFTRFDSAEALLEEAFDRILEGATNLAPEIKTLAELFEGTADQTIGYIDTLRTVMDMTERNPVDQAMSDMASASRSAYGVFIDQTRATRDLAREYDGSAQATAMLAQSLQGTQQAAYLVAQQFKAAQDAINGTFNGLRETIRTSMMSEEELYNYQRSQVHRLTDLIETMTDPARIMDATAQIEQLVGNMWGSLDEAQREAMGPEFLGYLDEAQAMAQDRLQQGLDSLERNQQRTNEAVQQGVRDAAAELSRAAASYQASANTFAAAVQAFNNGGGFNFGNLQEANV